MKINGAIRPMGVIGLLFLFLYSATAEEKVVFPISVPQECVALARREGVPVTIQNRHEARTAQTKLARLDDADPIVRECKHAVRRAKQAAGLN